MKQTYGKSDQPMRRLPAEGRPARELQAMLDLKVRCAGNSSRQSVVWRALAVALFQCCTLAVEDTADPACGRACRAEVTFK